jgi:hypothetical protein
VPARRAGLAGGVPAVDDDQVTAIPLALVLQLAAELAPAAIHRCARPGGGDCGPGCWPRGRPDPRDGSALWTRRGAAAGAGRPRAVRTPRCAPRWRFACIHGDPRYGSVPGTSAGSVPDATGPPTLRCGACPRERTPGNGCAGAAVPAARAPRTPRTRTQGPGPSSSRSAPGRTPRTTWLCPPGATGYGGQPKCGSTRPGRSRMCGSAPPAAPHPGTPDTCKPSSSLQNRTYDRESVGAAPSGRPSFPVPLRGAPDSSPT